MASSPPEPPAGTEFFTSSDGLRLQVFHFAPNPKAEATVFIAPGITGMNCAQDQDVFETLAAMDCRVTAIFPRGTGYSEGKRGDVLDFSRWVEDFIEGIARENQGSTRGKRIILFGHSMSCAVALAAARQLERVDGIILVNPPLKRKASQGMTPSVWEYIQYAGHYLFAPHALIVNMAGDPDRIADPVEAEEARQRNADPLLVKYFSLAIMMAVDKLLQGMPENVRLMSCPLLLIYGGRDSVVDEKGCQEIYTAWKHPAKEYHVVPNGPHGKATVISSRETISQWLSQVMKQREIK